MKNDVEIFKGTLGDIPLSKELTTGSGGWELSKLTQGEQRIYDLRNETPSDYTLMCGELGNSISNFSHTVSRIRKKGYDFPKSERNLKERRSFEKRIMELEAKVEHLLKHVYC